MGTQARRGATSSSKRQPKSAGLRATERPEREPETAVGRVRRAGRPAVVGHRGAMGSSPENTLGSFARAAKLGADWIELDVHLSRDGVPVVIHDDTLARTTSGRGAVRARSAAQLTKLDAGSWFGDAWASERVPTLEQALSWAEGAGVGVEIELKNCPVDAPGMEVAVVEALTRTGMLDRAMVIGFDHALVRRVKLLSNRILTGILYACRPVDELEMARRAKADVLLPHWSFVTEAGVAAAHGAGLAVAPWTTSERAVVRALLEAGVDAITTDHPDAVRRLVRSSR